MEESAVPAEESPAGPTSAVGRLVGVFVSPVRTLESIARRPSWILPMALWVFLSVAATAVLIPRTDWSGILRAQMEKSGQTLTDAQLEDRVRTIKGFSWTYYLIAVTAPFVIALVTAGVFWAALKAFGWDARFAQSLGVTAHAFLPTILASAFVIPVMWRMDRIDPKRAGDLLVSNLGFLVDQKSVPALHSLLQSIDLFSFWTMALLIIGLAAAARISRGKAAAFVVTFWILFVLGKAGFAALVG